MIGTNSFGLSDTGSEAAPVLADLDGDGDLDLLVGNADGNTLFFRNSGTTLSPTFTLDSTNPFGISNVSAGGALPGLVDIDGDGDLDLFIGNHAGTTVFLRNNGTTLAPTFSLEGTNLFGIQNAGSYGAPGFADLDGDGDLDLLIGNSAGDFLYFRNDGTTQAPTFSLTGTNPFGLLHDIDGYLSPVLADLNGDGLVDLINKSTVYINVGTAAAPTFSALATNPYGSPGPGAYPRPALGDLDGDGDRDLVIGVDGGDLEYFRNVSPVSVTLGNAGNTITLSQINTLTGGAGTDAVTLGSVGNTMLVGGVETLIGGIGTDIVTLSSLGNTIQVDGVETLTGGIGTDVVTLSTLGNTLTVSRLETLTGGIGPDVVTLASGGNTLLAEGIETLTGGTGADSVTLGSSGNTLTVRLMETLSGGSGTDKVTLGTGGNTLTVRLMESIVGGSGTDIVMLGTGGNTLSVAGVETLNGGSGSDTVTLDGSGNTLTVRLVETLIGGSGTDVVTFGTGGNTVWVSGLETLTGASGSDQLRLDSDGNTLTVRLVETLIGGSGTDRVMLGTGGNTVRVSGIETLTGDAGTDAVTLLTGGNTLTVSLLETLIGASGTDVVTLTGTGNTMLVSALETLIGGSGIDVVTVSASGMTALVGGIETLNGNTGVEFVTLDGGGNTLTVSRLETLIGGAGTDVVSLSGTSNNTMVVGAIETLIGTAVIDMVMLGSSGNTIEVSRIETAIGGSGTDVVMLGSGGNTLLVRLLETLTGGSGNDVVVLASGGNVMTVSGVETINGGSGLDIVTLGDSAGNTLTVWRIETLTGSAGTDVVTLASAGFTLQVEGVETLTGGLGIDVVTLGSAGNTLVVSGVETLTGGSGTDVVMLGSAGNTLVVSGVETLTGGSGTDVVTLGSAGSTLAVSLLETLVGGTGTDVVTFSPAGNQGTLFVSGVETVHTPFQTLTLNGTDTLIILSASPSTPALSPTSDSGAPGDGVTNASQPTLTGTADAGSVVHLYGNGVEIGTGTTNGSGLWSVVAGTTLADGTWTVTAKVISSGVESGPSGAFLVTIDSGANAPSALALSPASNSGSTADTLTSVTAPVITGTVAEAGVVVLYEGATALGTVTASAAGAWSITAASLSDGTHTLTATVTDAAGNTSAASSALTVTIDSGANAPSALALSPASNSGSTADTLTNATAPVITGSVSEAGVVVLYEGATVLGTVTASAAGAWSITAGSLSDGTHTLTATVTDAAGNTSSVSPALTVTIDSGASSPTGLALATASNSGSTADTLTNVTAPVITGTVAEAGVVVLYEGATVLGTVTASAAGAWSITAGSLSDGTHTLTATVTDAAGNTSSASTGLTVTIDSGASAPSALALSPASNSGSTADTLTSVTAPVITGAVAEAGVVVLYEGATALGTVTASAAGAWSITAASLSDGAHTLTATVTDAAGNTSSASSALTVTIDSEAPSVTVALDKTTLGLGETATVTFVFSEAPVGFSLSAVTAQNGTLSDLSVVPGSDGLVYKATLTPSVETLASDSHITVATGWSDTAGNTPAASATSVGYAIDTRTPSANTAPVIGGAMAGQAANDAASLQPFATLTVSDNQTAQAQTVVVTVRDPGGTVGDATGAFTAASLAASGFVKSSAGTYALTAGSAAAAQAALRMLDFQPTPNRAAPGMRQTTAFTVTVTDADGASVTNSTTSIDILSVNDAPVLAQGLGTRNLDQGQAFSYTIPTGTFTDADTGDSLTLSATSGDGSALPAWLSFDAATGRLTGTPGNADVGTRTVRVTATDSSGATVSDLLTIQVANVNDAPVATNDTDDTDRLTPVTVGASNGVLANDTDPDAGDRLVVSAVNGDAANVGRAITLAGGGRLTLNADGGYSFDPAGGYGTLLFGQTRLETVSYTVTDQAGATSTATLTITVRGVNTAPAVQEAKHVAIDQNSSRVGLSIDRPVDPEGDPLTITVTGLPTVGTLQRYDGTALAVGDTLTPDQLAAVIYTPPFGATGAAGSFSYAVSDGTNLVGRAVTISLTPVQWLSLTPSSLSIAEGNSGTTSLTYTITRRGDTSGATTVKWQVDTTGLSGSLADAADFGGTLPSGTVTFAAGETSRTITVPISGDRLVEGNERFRVLLFSPSTTVTDAKITVESATAVGTILNDDRAATITAVTGPVAGRYLAARGDTLDFTVSFSDAVSVSGGGAPRLALTIGTQTRYATLLRVDSGKLVFRYAVGADDLDSDGIAVAGTIDLNGAQIRDGAGNAVTSLSFGSAAPVTRHVMVNVRGGHAIDGYIAGATVFADANANGQLDDGEAFGTTNAVGSWSIPGGTGPIVMIGGTDISTNLAFTGVYEAPGSASVITPLTTIIMGMAGLAGTGSEIAAAATELKSKLGLDPGLDLLTYDPIVAVTTAGADAAAIAAALKTQAAAASVANVIVQGSAVLAGVVIGAPRASGVIGRALVGAIADAVKAVPAGGTIDLADPAVLAAILAAAGARIGAVDSVKLAAVTGGAANVIAASNGAVITAGTTNSGVEGLTQMAQAQVVAQGTAADELRTATATGDVSGAVAAFTGTNLQQQISAAQVAVVIPSRLAIAATDADKREGDGGTTAFTFTVTRAGSASGVLTVAWAVAAGDGPGGATLDAADFGGTLPSGTISFADGETTRTITVLVSGDTDIEPDETFTVSLSNPSVAATAIETATASGTIRNEDPIDPKLTLPGAQTVVAGTAAAIAGLSVTDGDSATVTVTLTPGNGSLGLAGPAAIVTAGDGTVTISGSVADVNTTLASLVFTGAGGHTAASVAVMVADGDPSTPDASGTLAVAIQSAPANVLPSSPTIVAGRSTEVLGLEIADIDGGTMTVVLTPTNGTLTLPLFGSATTSDLGNGKIRLTGSLEDVNRTLQQLEFTASRNVTSASIRFETSDDQPLTPDADSLLVIGVLSSPEHSAPASLSVVSGVATAVSGLSVSDYDSPTLQVTLTPSNGALALTAQGGVTLTQPSAGVWRLLGTQADITATLATLTFTGTAGQTSGTIRVTTSDLGTLTTDAEATIAVTITDPVVLIAPTLTLPQPITLNQGLDTALAGIQVTDPDSPSVTVTLTASQATLGATAAGQATVATAGDGTVTISGSVADVNATLAALRITGGIAAAATVAVTVSDGVTTPATGTLTLPMVDVTPPGGPTITAVSTDFAGTRPVTVTNRNRLFVRGTAEANSRVALSDGGTEVATVTADAHGAWVADLSATPIPDGSHAFTARATDAAGNTGPASGALSVTIDTIAPTTPSVAFNDATIDQAKQSSVGFVLSGGESGTTYRWTLSSSGGGDPLTGTGALAGSGGTIGGIDVSSLFDGTLSLVVTLTDAAGNVSVGGTATATKAAGAVVDGTKVQTLSSQVNGRAVATVVVQAPAADRVEDPGSPNAGLADVPLVRETVTAPASGQPALMTTLQVALPTGVGVTASGPAAREGASLAQADLIRAIEARTTTGSASRSDLSSGGLHYLSTLSQQASLLLRTLAFTAPATPGAAIRVSGAAAGSSMPTALVIDTTGAPGPLIIRLDTVSFVAVIGSATLSGGEGNQVVYGDAGSQSIILGPGDDLLSGGGGNDTVASTLGNDTLYGDGGDDLMHGGDGDDLMDGGADNDTMGGGAGNDTMGGGAGNDILIGEGGNDAVFGGVGDDSLFGGGGDDTLFGEDGNDILSLGAGDDLADGGAGNDTLFGEDGNDTLFGWAGNDILSLGAGNDLADGGAGNDTLFGEDGNDTLFGGAGDDVMAGGAGDDLLFLDQGADTVWGGAGADIFAFGRASGGSMVMDFTSGADRLALFDPSLDLGSVIASARVVNGSTVLDLRPGVSVTIFGQTGDVARWFA